MSANPTGALVNSVYPLSYFNLSGVTQISFPDKFWWSSKERYAAVDGSGFNYLSVASGGTNTSEILELDLGRVREINYINFDCLRAPINITIEYDAISTPDREPVWSSVVQTGDLPFENSTSFDPQNRNAWQNLEFNFTNEFGNMVHARYFRITFTRRDEVWPTSNAAAFQWPVFVKHLRTGRYIATLLDTVGPLLNQDTPNALDEFDIPNTSGTATTQVRQQFVIPAGSARATEIPNLLGFGVLIDPDTTYSPNEAIVVDGDTSFAWSLYDVTSTPIQILSGIVGPYTIQDETWLDFYLDESMIIPGDSTKIYELRLSSLNPGACNTVFTHAPNILSSTALPGTLTLTNGATTVPTTADTRQVIQPGQYFVRTDITDQPLLVSNVTSSVITLSAPYPGASIGGITGSVIYPFTSWNGTAYTSDASQNLVMRVWADIADEGQDVLGNAYRYVVRRQEAVNVFDDTQAGWMSDPKPTPEAVEALYFDVRQTDPATGSLTYSLIEALEIAPRTPGVRMNVYSTQENVHGIRPVTTDDWDNLYWEPVQMTYTLRRDEIIPLPLAIEAAFVKLEFTALNPLPYRLPSYPPLPPKQYRRFPTWIEQQFQSTLLKSTIQDWFLRNATPVEQRVLAQLADPVQEYQYEQSEFLAALSLGTITDQQTINSGIVDVADKALIDPTTGSKIYIQTSDQYGSPMLATVDQSTLLGQMVVQNNNSSIITQPTENQNNPPPGSAISVVSTTNDRISQSFQSLAQLPMRFYKPARHIYTIEEADFNKKAFFVGIDKVSFLRVDYSIPHDDTVVTETLYDDLLLIEDTFERDSETTIFDGETVYVSYQIGEESITDEKVVLGGFAPSELQVGGSQARNILVYAGPQNTGLQYFQGLDYELGYGVDPNGFRTTFIERSPLTERLSVPRQPVSYVDAFTVVGHGTIPQRTIDAGTVISQGVVTGLNFLAHADSFTVIGRGVVTGSDIKTVTPTYGQDDYGGGDYGNL